MYMYNIYKTIQNAKASIASFVTWLKYCRYGVKHQSINQSINQSMESDELKVELKRTKGHREKGKTIMGKSQFYF